MTHGRTWLMAALLAVWMVAPLAAQPDEPKLVKPPVFEMIRVGRYQVVRHTDREYILLDTATGKLYRADNEDLEPFKNLLAPKREPAKPVEKDGVVLEIRGHAAVSGQVRIAPEFAGRVTKILFEEGQKVKKGDILARLDDQLARVEVQDALAALEGLRELADRLKKSPGPAELERLKSAIDDLQKQESELAKLMEDIARVAKEGVKDPKYLAIRRDHDALRTRLLQMQQLKDRALVAPQEKIEAILADLKKAEGGVARARLKLEAHTILAPIDGIVLSRKVGEGEIVNPANRGAGILCEMADLSQMEIELDIPERDIGAIHQDQKCRVFPDAYQTSQRFRKLHPDGYFEGVVARILPLADRTKGAIPVRVKVKIPAGEEGLYLKPGMSTIVSFLKAEK